MTDEFDQPSSLTTAVRSIVAIAWVSFFVFAFFSFGPTIPFPEGDVTVEKSRLDLVTANAKGARPFQFIVASLFDNLLGGTDPKTEGWQFFQWQIVLYACGIIIGMIALGRLLLRVLRLNRDSILEANVFAFGLGVSATTLLVLGCGLAGFLEPRIFIGVLACATLIEVACSAMFRPKPTNADVVDNSASRGVVALALVLVAPMLLMMLLGALSPSTDFDVREYHLQGPKEYFQNGQITFLPHNAYTSFPFLTEMLSLLGMVVMGDWYTGALLGKVLLASFAPMTGLALIAAGRRCFDSRAGWLAAVVFLTTPWVYRISIIAYAEGGLTFFLLVSLLTVIRFSRDRSYSNLLLAGLMAGSAMACKYPALLSVVAPTGFALAWVLRGRTDETRGEILKPLMVFSVGIVVAVGPWLVKNLMETGNPVYPLAYSVFGGADWTPEINERWRAGHSPPNYKLSDLASRVVDVTIRSQWLSALLFAFAPLAFLAPKEWRRASTGFWCFVLWMFASWWIFTHRIDRFWVPMIPIVALLAGVGISSIRLSIARWTLMGMLTCGAVFSIVFSGSIWSGYNAWFTNPAVARKQIEDQFAGMLLRAEAYNERSSEPGKILCVGEAAVFEARSQVIYNTVFDLNIFQEICGESVSGGSDTDVKLRPISDVKNRLAERDVSYIVVNWLEVLRYRRPGSYGFSDFIQPATFQKLVDAGVLARLDSATRPIDGMGKHDQTQVEAWNAITDADLFVAQEIYRLVKSTEPD